jgi:hypothetical protein
MFKRLWASHVRRRQEVIEAEATHRSQYAVLEAERLERRLELKVRESEGVARQLESSKLENERLLGEVRHQEEMLRTRLNDLKYQIGKYESELEQMQRGAPQRMYETAFASGFEKGFDFSYGLQSEHFRCMLEKHKKEVLASSTERFDKVKLSLVSRIEKAASPHIVAMYDRVKAKLDRVRKLGQMDEAKSVQAQLDILEQLVDTEGNNGKTC